MHNEAQCLRGLKGRGFEVEFLLDVMRHILLESEVVDRSRGNLKGVRLDLQHLQVMLLDQEEELEGDSEKKRQSNTEGDEESRSTKG